jgi:hypothetical protein
MDQQPYKAFAMRPALQSGTRTGRMISVELLESIYALRSRITTFPINSIQGHLKYFIEDGPIELPQEEERMLCM